MQNKEQKQQIFIKLRQENYQASLRLEGFKIVKTDSTSTAKTPTQASVQLTLAQIKAKYVR